MSAQRFVLCEWSVLLFTDVPYLYSAGRRVELGEAHYFKMVSGGNASRPECGTGKVVTEEGEILLTVSHCEIVNMESMTLPTTAMPLDTYGLALVERSLFGCQVKELAGGSNIFEFAFKVKCTLKIQENLLPALAPNQDCAQWSEDRSMDELVRKVLQITAAYKWAKGNE